MSDISPLAPKGGFPKLPVIDGVRFAAVEAGVKYQGRLDVMLAEIAEGSAIAGTFTRSKTRAAPVLWCQENLAMGSQAGGSAILVNSGNANAFTGNNGMNGVEVTAGAVAETLGINRRNVFVASTGVIGEPLPSERITSKMGELRDGLDALRAEDAARAIMTTDTYAKGAKASVELDGVTVQIAGFAKGSGMIAPDMATMLVFVFTDAKITQSVLQEIVSGATVTTFNSITVDSDTSTSDSLVVTATGKAAMDEITSVSDPRAVVFADALRGVMLELAHLVVRDGEGATKFIEITVNGAESDAAAKTVGLSIANSPLVKTAFAGEDPNWGRIVMAIGKAGEAADRDKLSISFGDILVADKGWVSPDYREDDGADYMRGQDLSVTVDLGVGDGSATVWTCDLTHQYITINADYRS
ncbi:MAG: bifunctional glutamate N-acetyltransferase/amino-acid acetyltransferase ArgJ [Rhodobacteraceae bacterium]|nr:bifunctional glutamate N-acetyltransferase/amino-acid acetyltransferase ArgJ [Paracoccaceae bacterium]